MPYVTYYNTGMPVRDNLIDRLYAGTNVPTPNLNMELKPITFYTDRAMRAPDTMDTAMNRCTDLLLNFMQNNDLDKLREHYQVFNIPKHSGGYRTISAPDEELKTLLRQIKDIFVARNGLKLIMHDAAYAYVPGRCAADALKKHQANESRWFLKMDIENFFPSCNPQFILKQMRKIYPSNICYEQDSKVMHYILRTATLDNGLPQGTPLSPLLSNLVMLPIDYKITNLLKHLNKDFIYTRYADDMLISSKYSFNWHEIQHKVEEIFREEEAPFRIKQEKTRYGSSAGRNWNLGLMLNKDNKITLGHKKKQRLKAAVNNFLRDFTNNQPWSIMDTYTLQGELSYFRSIEPEYADFIVQRLEQKYNVSLRNCIQQILNPV